MYDSPLFSFIFLIQKYKFSIIMNIKVENISKIELQDFIENPDYKITRTP